MMVNFDEYKKHNGELTRQQFERLANITFTKNHLDKAFKAFLSYGMPDIEQWNQCARLIAMFPNKANTLWHITESYLTLGRF